ncbi:MAG: TonB family protein [Paludibacteraceae bacterium]|nr:TonB family protein [Paludibacteraceae bacterium]
MKTTTSIQISLVAALALLLAACGSSSTNEPVEEPQADVAVLRLSPRVIDIYENGSEQIRATLYDELGNVVEDPVIEWSTSDKSVVTVDPKGRITAYSNIRTATVTATAYYDKKEIVATCQVNVLYDEEQHQHTIFDTVEEAPSFPGGRSAFDAYIEENLTYPALAKENGIQGRVFVKFIVHKTGMISDVEVIRGVDNSLDRAAVSFVSTMPDWIPGKQNGQDVCCYVTEAITFRLK